MKTLLRSLYHQLYPVLRNRSDNPFFRAAVWLLMNGLLARGTRMRWSPASADIIRGDRLVRLSPSHWIYVLTVAKDFDIYFNCVVSKREGAYEVVDYSRTGLQTFRLSNLVFEVTGFPEEEESILDYFRWYRPRAGETVFDLGANCGLSTYYLSQSVGATGKVYAFEPDKHNFKVLTNNIARHNLTNVVPLQIAISGTSGEMTFFSEGTIGSTLARNSNRPTTGTEEIVTALTLADACKRYGIPSFVKIDIEGAEIEAIAAARELLGKESIQFALDTNHYVQGELTTGEVERLFRSCGYETMSSKEKGLMTTWARKPA